MRALLWGFQSELMSTRVLSVVMHQDSAWVHASCVAVADQGILVIGASGSGKSALALRMLSLGAGLVADDRVILEQDQDQVIATAVPHLSGVIEARQIGLLRAEPYGPAPLAYVVDLDREQPARLPDPVSIQVLGQCLPLFHGANVPSLPEALIQIATMGCLDPQWPSN